jgi:hypothetical protein
VARAEKRRLRELKKKQEEELDRIRAAQNADITAEGVRFKHSGASRPSRRLPAAADARRAPPGEPQQGQVPFPAGADGDLRALSERRRQQAGHQQAVSARLRSPGRGRAARGRAMRLARARPRTRLRRAAARPARRERRCATWRAF